MRKSWIVAGIVFLVGSAAAAQTKISGTEQCGKAVHQFMVQVGDSPSHAISIAQWKCTWPKPIEIEGVQVKESVITGFYDVRGSSARARGYDIGTMADGDRSDVRYESTATFEGGAWRGERGTWTFFGGSGKLEGLKGKGTYECKPAGEGFTCAIEGEYALPKEGE